MLLTGRERIPYCRFKMIKQLLDFELENILCTERRQNVPLPTTPNKLKIMETQTFFGKMVLD